MSNYKKYIEYSMDTNPDWKLLEDMFSNNYENNAHADKVDIIPKKIHQFWIGGTKLPDKYKRLSESWIKCNPDWEYRLWVDDDVEGLNMINKTLYDKAHNVGIKSDILRYEILYKFGGISADTDFECLKSFNDLRYLDLFAGNGYSTFPHVYCGLIGIKPQHELMLRILQGLKAKENMNVNVDFGEILKLSGPDYFSDLFFKYLHENEENRKNCVIFPQKYFYALSPGLRHELNGLTNDNINKAHTFICDVSYALHYWCTSWQK
jgi:mannosyltransferase OCH1-like enzyme